MCTDGIKLVEFCDRMMGCGDDKKNNIKTTQEYVIEREIDHVKCLQCGQVHFVGKGLPLPEIGWCGCDNNARTSWKDNAGPSGTETNYRKRWWLSNLIHATQRLN